MTIRRHAASIALAGAFTLQALTASALPAAGPVAAGVAPTLARGGFHGGYGGYGGYRGGYYNRPGAYRPAYRPGGYWGGWRRPAYGWSPGGAIAAGAAIGFLGAAAAAAYASSAAPAPGLCWYYTDATYSAGFWDACP